MSVRDALAWINRAISEYLNPEGGSFDAETQFCSGWFAQYGWGEGPFGEADTLSRAKGTSVEGVGESGVIAAGTGKVRLLKWSEYDWKGENPAGRLLAKMPQHGEGVRQLPYHLYTLCERKKWAEDARAYNELIVSWYAIVEAGNQYQKPELEF